jgi:hypothetical protein
MPIISMATCKNAFIFSNSVHNNTNHHFYSSSSDMRRNHSCGVFTQMKKKSNLSSQSIVKGIGGKKIKHLSIHSLDAKSLQNKEKDIQLEIHQTKI